VSLPGLLHYKVFEMAESPASGPGAGWPRPTGEWVVEVRQRVPYGVPKPPHAGYLRLFRVGGWHSKKEAERWSRRFMKRHNAAIALGWRPGCRAGGVSASKFDYFYWGVEC